MSLISELAKKISELESENRELRDGNTILNCQNEELQSEILQYEQMINLIPEYKKTVRYSSAFEEFIENLSADKITVEDLEELNKFVKQ